MIKTVNQLKALIRNKAENNSGKAQLLIRNYAMERFLERISLSDYKDNFIVKGGILVASLVGLDSRATMDIDTTVRNFPLDEENTRRIISEISTIELEDNMRFELRSISSIMDEADYNGLRIMMDAYLERTRIPLKIDISTGDIITPRAIEYSFRLMFEDRSIDLWAYNLETILAEKLETIISRGALNTRMRDFYDLYILQAECERMNPDILRKALYLTSDKRNSLVAFKTGSEVLKTISMSDTMKSQWQSYRKKNEYVGELEWDTIMDYIMAFYDKLFEETADRRNS